MDISNKKYKLLSCNEKGLYRIMALRDFSDVKKGDIGGYIESERNLSHFGNAWVYDDARVFDEAVVLDDARVMDIARVNDRAVVSDNAVVKDSTGIRGNCWVAGNAVVFDHATVLDNAFVAGNARVGGFAEVKGNARIIGDALVETIGDYIVFKNWWSSGRFFTWTRSNNMWAVGCFYGKGDNLIEQAYGDSEESGCEYERVVKYVESIQSF